MQLQQHQENEVRICRDYLLNFIIILFLLDQFLLKPLNQSLFENKLVDVVEDILEYLDDNFCFDRLLVSFVFV